MYTYLLGGRYIYRVDVDTRKWEQKILTMSIADAVKDETGWMPVKWCLSVLEGQKCIEFTSGVPTRR